MQPRNACVVQPHGVFHRPPYVSWSTIRFQLDQIAPSFGSRETDRLCIFDARRGDDRRFAFLLLQIAVEGRFNSRGLRKEVLTCFHYDRSESGVSAIVDELKRGGGQFLAKRVKILRRQLRALFVGEQHVNMIGGDSSSSLLVSFEFRFYCLLDARGEIADD